MKRQKGAGPGFCLYFCPLWVRMWPAGPIWPDPVGKLLSAEASPGPDLTQTCRRIVVNYWIPLAVSSLLSRETHPRPLCRRSGEIIWSLCLVFDNLQFIKCFCIHYLICSPPDPERWELSFAFPTGKLGLVEVRLLKSHNQLVTEARWFQLQLLSALLPPS